MKLALTRGDTADIARGGGGGQADATSGQKIGARLDPITGQHVYRLVSFTERRHARTHARTHASTRVHTHMHACTHVHARRHACIHVPTHAHAHKYVPACAHTCAHAHAWSHMCTHACTHARTAAQASPITLSRLPTHMSIHGWKDRACRCLTACSSRSQGCGKRVHKIACMHARLHTGTCACARMHMRMCNTH